MNVESPSPAATWMPLLCEQLKTLASTLASFECSGCASDLGNTLHAHHHLICHLKRLMVARTWRRREGEREIEREKADACKVQHG